MERKTGGGIAIACSLLVLFTAMLDPRWSLVLAVLALAVLIWMGLRRDLRRRSRS